MKFFSLFTYLLNIDIDIDIAIFSKYRINIVSKSKKWYRPISTREAANIMLLPEPEIELCILKQMTC